MSYSITDEYGKKKTYSYDPSTKKYKVTKIETIAEPNKKQTGNRYNPPVKTDQRTQALTQGGKTGVPVIKRQGETDTQALQRSAQRTAAMYAASNPNRSVSVQVSQPTRTQPTSTTTNQTKPTSTTTNQTQTISKPQSEIQPYNNKSLMYKLESTGGKYETLAKQQKGFSTLKGVSYTFGAAATGFVKRPIEYIKTLSNPKQAWEGIKQTVKNPFSAGYALKEELIKNPAQTGGALVFDVTAFKMAKAAGSATKSAYIKTGSSFVEPEKVFSSQVLKQGKTFPMTTSSEAAIKSFEATKTNAGTIKVVTASPQKLKSLTAGQGERAVLGLEDPGIYVTPKGQGSPYFLGVDKVDTPSKFTLNPVSAAKSFKKDVFGVPTVTEFEATGVSRLPKSVSSKPGFEAVRIYQETKASKTGNVLITKRSQLGQGELKPQTYILNQDKIDKLLNTKNTFKEVGTSELEAVVPKGSKFEYTSKSTLGKLKGFDEYTLFEGKPVALRSAKILTKEKAKAPISRGSKVVSFEKISGEAKYLSSSASSKVVTPYGSSIKAGVRGSVYSSSKSSSKASSKLSSSLTSSSLSSNPLSSSLTSTSSTSYPPKISSAKSITSSKESKTFSSGSSGSLLTSSSVSSPTSSYSKYSGTSYTPSVFSFKSGLSKVTKGFGKSKKDNGLFEVFSVSRGNVFSLGNFGSKEKAAKVGLGFVRSTPSASFKVTRLGSDKALNLKGLIGGGFNPSKSRKGFYVEKSAFRINTAGELKGITALGVKASKKKNKNWYGGIFK
jgi:hypothetical protein